MPALLPPRREATTSDALVTDRDRLGACIELLVFLTLHVVAVIGIGLVGISIEAIALAAVSYAVRVWAVAAGFHRYFSHHSFALGRPAQFVIALLATLAMQKGVLWWVSTHRKHHLHADTPADPHSPRHRSFAYSHCGWLFDPANQAIDPKRVRDWTRFPELVWLQRFAWVPVAVYATTLSVLFGATGFVWGFAVSTVILWHSILTTGSFSHRLGGYRNFDLADDSRNNRVIALMLLGEGWHNNHHRAPSSARHATSWREPDPIYWSLLGLRRLGVVTRLRDTMPRLEG